MPRLVAAPTTVVKTTDVEINEFFGGASCNPCPFDISAAHVKAKGGWAEEWQTPAFDEYTILLKGRVTIEHSHGPPVSVQAGQAIFMPKGERVRWVFTEPAEYIPICLPAFSPDNCFREEGPTAAPPAHDKHVDIYHLVQTRLWEACKAQGTTYYPPTYEQDGFTHATADPAKLLAVANYFYQDVEADWLCLKMTRATLEQAGITLKFEDPSPVGSKKALTASESGGERFPHLYSGIPPAGVVVQEYVVRRSTAGEFLSIDGLCSADPAAAAPTPLASLLAMGKRLQQMLPAPPSLACGCVGAAAGFVLASAMAKGR